MPPRACERVRTKPKPEPYAGLSSLVLPDVEHWMQQEPSGGDRPVRIGQRSEAVAALWLEGRGFTILDRNRRGGDGEIDLMARQGDALIFVEVRSRRRGSWVGAAASIGFDKRRRLRSCAHALLARREDLCWPGRRIRFDVITLEYDAAGFDLRHLVGVRV